MLRKKRNQIFAIVKAGIAVCVGIGTATGDVLYDTLDLITEGTANNTNQPAFIGYFSPNDVFLDLNVAEDFDLSESYTITLLTQPLRLGSVPEAELPADGILVEFFENTEINRPAQDPIAAALMTEFSVESFNYPGVDEPSWYFTVDLSSAEITLESGTWWVSMTPVDMTETAGDWRVFRQTGAANLIGHHANRRAGGVAHGNGIESSLFYANTDWAPWPGPLTGNIAIRIEGTPSGPKCDLADLNCDGSIGVPDLLLLLGAWGACADCGPESCETDLTGDCSIGVPDLLELLANWG